MAGEARFMDLRQQMGRIGLWTFGFGARSWSEASEHLAELDELGYRATWIPEAVSKDPFALAASMLGASERLVVATGIANIHLRSALAMKSAWLTLSENFPDRFLLGLGVSHAPMVESFTDHAYERPVATMDAYLEALDSAPYAGAAPTTPPRRVLGALGPRMLELARERTDGAHPYNVTPDHTARAREILGAEAFLAPEHKVIPTTDATQARQLGREGISVYLGLPNYRNNLLRSGFEEADFDDGGSDRLIDALFAWGDEEQIAERIGEHLEAGADHVAVQVFRGYGAQALPVEDWRALAPALLEL